MKTKYAVTRDGEVIVESDDLDYIKKIKEEYTYRRTGRTTRLLFQAFGDSANEIVIVCRNRSWANQLCEIAAEMLTKLGFEVLYHKSESSISNFGKTYHFRTREELKNIPRGGTDKYSKLPKYLDQD